jgi:hypothetical protein
MFWFTVLYNTSALLAELYLAVFNFMAWNVLPDRPEWAFGLVNVPKFHARLFNAKISKERANSTFRLILFRPTTLRAPGLKNHLHPFRRIVAVKGGSHKTEEKGPVSRLWWSICHSGLISSKNSQISPSITKLQKGKVSDQTRKCKFTLALLLSF